MTIFFKFHEPTSFDVLRVNEDSFEVTLAGVVGIGNDGVWMLAEFRSIEEGGGATATRYPDTDLLSVLQQVYTKLGGRFS